MTADSTVKELHKLRLLTDTVEPDKYVTNYTKSFEVHVSLDGLSYELALTGETMAKNGEWAVFEFETAVQAKYVKVKLTASQGENAEHRELAELQLFGLTPDELATNPDAANNSVTLSSATVPDEFSLGQNYPNPFNPETTVNYQLPTASDVTLNIYNVQGQLIRTLATGNKSTGFHQIVWDARDDVGNIVGSGVYFYQLRAVGQDGEQFTMTRRMALLK